MWTHSQVLDRKTRGSHPLTEVTTKQVLAAAILNQGPLKASDELHLCFYRLTRHMMSNNLSALRWLWNGSPLQKGLFENKLCQEDYVFFLGGKKMGQAQYFYFQWITCSRGLLWISIFCSDRHLNISGYYLRIKPLYFSQEPARAPRLPTGEAQIWCEYQQGDVLMN